APLTAQAWPVRLYATYTLLDAVPPIPDLCAALMQSPADLWLDSTRTQQLTEVTLKFGEELVVRSIDSASGTLLPDLFITPAI
ncbi:MAG: hypothetical protein J2P36_04305, partial [Ktedonobacteraceae bacterium]|nr:hypothetical protein [Ktedonobacteraceae bacterium]